LLIDLSMKSPKKMKSRILIKSIAMLARRLKNIKLKKIMIQLTIMKQSKMILKINKIISLKDNIPLIKRV